MGKGYLVVEGHGDKYAALNLVHRVWRELGLPHLTWDPEPIRGKGLLTQSGVIKACEHLRAKPQCERALLLRDEDDLCPKERGICLCYHRRTPPGQACCHPESTTRPRSGAFCADWLTWTARRSRPSRVWWPSSCLQGALGNEHAPAAGPSDVLPLQPCGHLRAPGGGCIGVPVACHRPPVSGARLVELAQRKEVLGCRLKVKAQNPPRKPGLSQQRGLFVGGRADTPG